MKTIVIAVDSFKGSLSANKVAYAVKKACIEVNDKYKVIELPISDGGERLEKILVSNLRGTHLSLDSKDALLRPIKSQIGILKDCVIMDIASSIGLSLLTKTEQNPMNTSSFGAGMMIKRALSLGYKNLLIGIGGSATNDAGLGMLQCLGLRCYDFNGKEIDRPISGGMMNDISDIDISNMNLSGVKIKVACDVNNSLCGKNGAAYVYALQKGASEEDLQVLDSGLNNIRKIFIKHFGIDANLLNGAGAAGGLGAALGIVLNAELCSGIDCVLDLLQFDSLLQKADLVITGEGKVDKQSFMGKALSGVLHRTIKKSVPLVVIGGKIEDKDILDHFGIMDYIEASPRSLSLDYAMQQDIAAENIYISMKKWLIKNAENF